MTNRYSICWRILAGWLALTGAMVFLTGDVASGQAVSDERILSYSVDLKKQSVELYWKDDSGVLFGNFQRLKDWLGRRHRRLVFAMNGGMFKADRSPVGLFVEHGIILAPIDTASGEGNFYMKPNGVLYIPSFLKRMVVRMPCTWMVLSPGPGCLPKIGSRQTAIWV